MANSSAETIQEIAFKLMLEQNNNNKILNGTKTERTLFVLGSPSCGKSTLINNFLDRNEPVRTTLALEYSYARRTATGQSNQKLVGNIWELGSGSLANSSQLIEVPIKSHGLEDLSVVIMLNLSEPSELLSDLECALNGLKQAITNNYSDTEVQKLKQNIIRSHQDHPDINTLDVLPCNVIIIGGKYDQFETLNSEIKRNVVKFLRSISHTLGATLIFYSIKIPSLAKSARDVFSNLAFGSPQNPIRQEKVDFNEPISIRSFSDTWEKLGLMPSNSEKISIQFSTQIQQSNKDNKENNKEENAAQNPTKDPNFIEKTIDDLRAMKDEELLRLIKNSEIKMKFDSFNLASSPFNYLN